MRWEQVVCQLGRYNYALPLSWVAILTPNSLHLGILLTEVITIGDGMNDIPLLPLAGLGIAMGNAPAEVKAAADYTTLDVEHGGLAEAIRKFLL